MQGPGARLRTLSAPLADGSLRRLWLACLVSEGGDWMARLALGLLVYAQTGDPLAVAAVTTVSLLPHLGIGQLLGTLADRYPHRTVMVVSDVWRGVLYLLLAATDLPIPLVLAVAFLAGLADPPFGSANFAALPQLAGDRYLAVQTLFVGTRQLVALLGLACGGVLVAASSPAVALTVNGLSFLAGAALVAGIRQTRSAEEGEDGGDGEDGEGRRPLVRPALRALTSERLVVVSVSVVTLAALLGVAVESLVVAYAAHLGLGAGGAGLLATVPPVGALLVALVLPSEGSHTRLVRTVCWTVAGMSAVAGVVLALDSPVPVVLVAFLAAGALDMVTVPAGVVIGERLPQAVRGTAFSFLEGALMTVQAGGALLAGALAAATSVSLASAQLALPAVVGGLVGLLVVGVRRSRDVAAVPVDLPAAQPALAD